MDIAGDFEDLIGTPILDAEEVTNNNTTPAIAIGLRESEYTAESYTWTFYIIRTIKGSVTIRWYGESNGYYSEDVSFARIAKRKKPKPPKTPGYRRIRIGL